MAGIKDDVVMEDIDLFDVAEDNIQENAQVFTEELLALKQQKQEEEEEKFTPFDQYKFKYKNVENRIYKTSLLITYLLAKFDTSPVPSNTTGPPIAGDENIAAGYDGYDEDELDFQISDRFGSMSLHAGRSSSLKYELEDWGELPRLALRDDAEYVDPEAGDFLFQVNDITVGKDKDFGKGKVTTMYLHGNNQKGHTVCYEYHGYKPFLYLSMPELHDKVKEQQWADDLIEGLQDNDEELPFDELYDYKVEYKVNHCSIISDLVVAYRRI
jgi:hypothetical protein